MERAKEFTERSLIYYRTRLLCPNAHGVQRVVSVKDDIATLECRCERGESLSLQPGQVSVEQLASRDEQVKTIAGTFFPKVSPVRDWRLELSAI